MNTCVLFVAIQLEGSEEFLLQREIFADISQELFFFNNKRWQRYKEKVLKS